jgi:selenide,water dikinase
LAQVLRRLDNLPVIDHPDLLVGIAGGDDAGVYRLSAELALVQTVDFFTPIVDDPDDWGRIAAANALSDIYAMGAHPLTALQLVGWPRDELPFDLLGRVVEGGASVLAAAGCTLVGGHSIDDREPKYGFAITGVVHPEHVITNVGARPGDVLVLTKPIGTGLIATGIKAGVASEADAARAVAVMSALNDGACRAMVAVGVSAATDVTGFGLLGHLGEMLSGGLDAEIDAAAIPSLPGALEMAERGVVPGGTRRNLDHAAGFTDFGDLPDAGRLLVADAQTSGGLLIAVAPERLDRLVTALRAENTAVSAVIGEMSAGAGHIRLRRARA